MNRDNDRIVAEATAWHAAGMHDDMDWDGFTEWLGADPAHRRAYDEVALADALLDEHRETLGAAFDDEPVAERAPATGSWKRWAGMAIAASLVGLMAIPQFLKDDARVYRTTAASRTVALEDGSTIMLAPHSRMSVEDDGKIALTGGAWFDIRHDPSRRLTINAADVTIGDIGTRFDVQVTGRQVRVEVAEGKVEVSSPALGQPLRLTQGRGLFFDGARGTATLSDVTADNAGEWRQGRLTYEAAPLSLVAADLSRYAALRVSMPESLRDRPFSGTLVIGDGKTALRDLSQVMDLELGRDAGGYRLSEPAR